MNKYCISDSQDRIDIEKYNWLISQDPCKYNIDDIGYLFSDYRVEFLDPKLEILYLLRFENV